jgi:16S rRNA (uracil1498-N3)-methyltransferase
MVDRYFLPQLPTGDACELAGAEFHHLAHVMRGSRGERLVVFDGQGIEADAEIVCISKTSASLRLADRRSESPKTRPDVVLATAVPKADRFRWLVEKATELGVDRLIPLQTARSIVAPGAVKLDKMRQAVIEACKQSGRNRLMPIDSLMSWNEFVKVVAANTCTYIADPTGLPLAQVSAGQSKPAPVLLVVGPEGGLTETELRESVDAGAHLVNLGPRILRTETAALALVAALLLN